MAAIRLPRQHPWQQTANVTAPGRSHGPGPRRARAAASEPKPGGSRVDAKAPRPDGPSRQANPPHRLAAQVLRLEPPFDFRPDRARRCASTRCPPVVCGTHGRTPSRRRPSDAQRSGWRARPGLQTWRGRPGPNPLRAISTPRASRAERMALGVKPCSCATRLSSAAGTGSPTNAARRNSIASALAVRVSVPAVSALVIVTYGVGTPSCWRSHRASGAGDNHANNLTQKGHPACFRLPLPVRAASDARVAMPPYPRHRDAVLGSAT